MLKIKDLKENMYLRFDGEIGKITSVTQTEASKIYGYYDIDYITTSYSDNLSSNGNNEVKASFNIIDLIEEDDYVNGYKVIDKSGGGIKLNDYENYKEGKWIYEDIKIILTKEQIKANQYEVSQ